MFKKFTSILMIISLVTCNFKMLYAGGGNPEIIINKTPKVDINVAIDNRATKNTNINNSIQNSLEDNVICNDLLIKTNDISEIRAEDANFTNIINQWETIGAQCWSVQNENINGNNYNTIKQTVINGSPTWDNSPINYEGRIVTYDKYPPFELTYYHPGPWKDLGVPFGYSAGYTTALINPKAYKTNKATFRFKTEATGNLNSGFCFNVQRNGNRLSGYFLQIVNHSVEGINPSNPNNRKGVNYQCGLYRFENVNFDCGEAYSIYYSPGWGCSWEDSYLNKNVGTAGTYQALCKFEYKNNPGYLNDWTVITDNGQILIKLKDNYGEYTIFNQQVNDFIEGSYGFWGLNCERVDSVKYISLNVEAEQSKSFSDIIDNSTFRDNTIKTILSIQTEPENSLIAPSTIAKVTT